MKRLLLGLVSLSLVACAASVASQYSVSKEVDKFNNNDVTVTMKGGVIDVDKLGIVSNAVEFDPFVVRSKKGHVVLVGMNFSRSVVDGDWLNISKGDEATFLLDDGAKVQLRAITGDTDYTVSDGYTTKYDYARYLLPVKGLKEIANAKSVEVRVHGFKYYEDYPRKPNNDLNKLFLPNIKKFYDDEVAPYIK